MLQAVRTIRREHRGPFPPLSRQSALRIQKEIASTTMFAKETLHFIRKKNEYISLTEVRLLLHFQRQSEVIMRQYSSAALLGSIYCRSAASDLNARHRSLVQRFREDRVSIGGAYA